MKNHFKYLLCASMAAMCAFVLPVYADNPPFSVSGWVCDSLSMEPQAYATIRLLQAGGGSKVVRAVTTDAQGGFKISAPKAGRYTLEAFVVGMQPVRCKVDLSDEHRSVSLDTLYIKEYTSSLGTATVTAQKPLVRAEIDKITYSMSDDPEAQTNSTLEMLRKVPMVTVDGEDNIKVNGSSSFQVYVNGKPNKMMSANPSTIFKEYPASVIKKIEVITNPGAKYDAEGVAGVLNIITNTETSTSGYTFNPSFSYNNKGWRTGMFAMAQVGKFMLSANYGIGKHSKGMDYTGYSEREVFDDAVNHLLKRDLRGSNEGTFQHGSLDASYDFSAKDLLTASVGLFGWKGDNLSLSTLRMFGADDTSTYAYRQHQRIRNKFLSTNVSVDYQHKFKDEQTLTFSYRYDLSPERDQSEVMYSDLENQPAAFAFRDLRTDPDNRTTEHTGQVDFTTKIADKHTISAGVKYIYRLNSSNSEEFSRPAGTDEPFTIDPERSMRYRHRGDIGAAYAEYSLKLDKWSFMAGSRYEYFHVRVTYPDGKRPSFSTDLSDWIPSASVGYSLKPTMLLRAGYNLRLGRPGIDMLSPYEEHNAPEFITYGNPNLGSTKAHNLNVSYSTFGPKLTLNSSLTYTFSNDENISYSFIEDGVQHTTYGNFLHSQVTSLSAYVNWTIVNGTLLNLNLSGNYEDYKSNKTQEHNSGFSGNFFGGLTQDLPLKVKMSLWAGGGTRRINLQGTSPGYYFYSLTLSRSFLKEDRLKLTLSAGNFIGRYRHFNRETVTSQFRSLSSTRMDFMNLGCGISYRLGSLKAMVKKTERSIENNDAIQKSSDNQGGAGVSGGGM